MQDWNYLTTNDFEITLELGCFKYPPHSQLKNYWEDNREALVSFIEHVHTGVKGFVIDEATGKPISNENNATIEVDEIHHPIVSGPSGDYFRLLKPGGTYTLSAVAPGYDRNVVHNIYVGKSVQILNFTLSHDKSVQW